MRDLTNGLFKLPSASERAAARAGAPLNPIKLAAMLSPLQGLMFFSGWLAWTSDAVDFFSVSLSVTALTADFDQTANAITTAITLTLLFRPLGAVVLGLLSDRFGRKWPLVVNLIVISALAIGTSRTQTFAQFLAVRCLFGVAMGGVWGNATATALENMPAAPRGFFSGVLQQGYAVGYLFSASVNLTLVAQHGNNWRILFYFSACFAFTAAVIRALLPESELFLRQRREKEEKGLQTSDADKAKTFVKEIGHMLKVHWGRCIFGVLLMTGFNFLSHSSQDLYPTVMQSVKFAALEPAVAKSLASKATIISNCGAIVGGMFAGYLSQYLGRRLTIILFIVLTGVLIPAWILPTTFSGLAAGAFWLQFGVQGAWGVVPIYLSEISPPAFRTTYAGVAYQLGNMISAASAQIETRGGESLQIPNPKKGQPGQPDTIPDSATVSGILLGVVCVYLIIVTIFGKEYRGAEFEKAPLATKEGAGDVDGKELTPAANGIGAAAAATHSDDIEVQKGHALGHTAPPSSDGSSADHIAEKEASVEEVKKETA